MADTDCFNCGHTTHRVNKCSVCGCETWARGDHVTARALLKIVQDNQMLVQCVVDMLALLCELHPEAVDKIEARREQLRKERDDKKEETTNRNFTDTESSRTD